MMRERQGTRLNCFSPPVMLVTLTIETALAIYTVWRYKMSVMARLAVLTLVTLAIFQLAEYFVCTSYGLQADDWSRLGFIAISAMPPLGLHILHVLTNKPKRRLVLTAYASMAGFIIYFLSYHAVFIGYKCTGNYVIFQIGQTPARLYGVYYYGWLLSAMVLAMHWANQLRAKGKQAKKQLQTVQAMIIGYLVFLVPTALAYSVKPSTRGGIPSVMCGFAVLFALILTFYILPRSGKLRRTVTARAA